VASVQREVVVDGHSLDLVLTRKRVKNVNARLVGSELRVSAPHRVSDAELEPIVERLARRLIRRRRAEQVNSEADALALARRVAGRFSPRPEVADVTFSTNQTSRWGSYSLRTRRVRLNAALRQMPSWVLEAVVAHELAHVVHPNHSPAFWKLLREVCAETDRARAFLEGVSWLGRAWAKLPPVERSLLGVDVDGC